MKDNKDFNDVKVNPDIEMGTLFRFDNFVCEVDDYNQDNPNESIVFIYESDEKQRNGEYLEQVSLLNENIKENIEEYMIANYSIKNVSRLSILLELQDQVNQDFLAYSKNYLMSEPLSGYEKEWEHLKEKRSIISQIIKDERGNLSKSNKIEEKKVSSTQMNSLGIYHKMNKKFIPMLEDFIIYRDIKDCAREKGITLSNKEILDLKEIILDFYNEDSVTNFPLSHSTRFIANNYIDNNISMRELRESSYYDIYDAIENENIELLRDFEQTSKPHKNKNRDIER